MLLRIQHETKLTYSAPVVETVFEVRMSPLTDDDQTTLGYRLKIAPAAPVTAYRDGFGNRVELFNIPAPYQELVVVATSYVRTHRRPGDARLAAVPWDPARALPIEVLDYLRPSQLVDHSAALDAFVAGLPAPSGSLAEVVAALKAAVRGRLAYTKRVTTSSTTLGQALDLGRGVCQDIVHLFLGASRGIGLPARYVSGYVHVPGEVETHAWCQVWGGPAGWVDIDPTHGKYVDDDYVAVAVGRDYHDVPPNRGVYKGRADEAIAVGATIEPADRVPYELQGWAEPAPWVAPDAPGYSFQVQRQGPGGFQYQRQGRPAGNGRRPNPRDGYRHQQGQQQ